MLDTFWLVQSMMFMFPVLDAIRAHWTSQYCTKTHSLGAESEARVGAHQTGLVHVVPVCPHK
jgi:hypothetical protein